ncbi:MAG: PAS domain S-box protein [Chloroflexi bacterium]|nr:PAS domain S-box protein [Chloroflexota bacterium]
MSLKEWRRQILDRTLRATFFIWAVALLVGIYNVVQSQMLQEDFVSAIILVIVYVVALIVMGAITFRQMFSFRLRSGVILLTVYSLGMLGLFRTGLEGDGRIFLLAFIVITTIFHDLRRSIQALIISVATIAAAALLPQYPLWDTLFNVPLRDETVLAWISAGAVFTLLSVAMMWSVSSLIRSLDRSLTESRRERNFASAILETSGALVALFEPDGRIVRFNRACEEITDYTFSEVQGKYLWDLLLTPGGVDLTKLVFEQVKEGDQPSAYECHWLTKDGRRRHIAWSTTALRDQEGAIEYIVSAGIDVTIHQQVEAERERLLAAEHEQRLLAETLAEITLAFTSQISPTAVLDEIIHRVRRVVPFKTANIALIENETLRIARWQGYETFGGEEAIANSLQPLSAFPLDKQAVDSCQPIVTFDTRQEPRWNNVEGTDWVRSHLIIPIVLHERVLGLLRLDGNMPGEFSAEDAQRLQPLANAAAIALENARLHQETLRQARRVQQILDTAHDGIVLLDARHRIELANPAAQSYLESLGDAGMGEQLSRLAELPLSKLLEPLPDGILAHELTIPREGRIFEAAAQRLLGDTPAAGWVLILREVTEARKQQQYAEAQERLAMVGQLAAGIAHDFNNIMTVIILYAQTLLKMSDFASGDDPRMGIIFKQAKLAANLIAQILDFSRQSVMERRPVNMVYFLKELLKMLKRTLPENIKLDLVYDEAEYGVSADLTRLQQAVMNLAVNARDAMPDGGVLCMALDRLTLEPGDKPPLPGMELGDWVTLEVSDTGTGVKAQDLPHVFEPFFTTKAPGEGTGLGLAQVYGIVKQHDGFIDATSREREGTAFKIFLPSLNLTDVLLPAQEDIVISEGGGETILVVEDDENALEAVCEILRTLNYRALAASNGEQALKLFERNHAEIALVISDMVMPGISGSKLYTRLRKVEPDIKMVIITGYPFDEKDKALLSQGIVAWVQKPFVMEQIAVAIREALSVSRRDL